MKLIILAAGEGVRMRPLTLTTPKPLLVYGGKTSLDHLFGALPEEITEVIIAVDYLAEQIRAHCGTEFYGRKVTYVTGSREGNAIGFLNTKDLFTPDERLAVSYGDEVITAREMKECLAHSYAWLCYEMDEPKNVGVARLGEGHTILEVIEKPEVPPSNVVANGFMVANADIFTYQPEKNKNGEYYFSSLMNTFCKHHEVYAVLGPKDHAQMSTSEDLARLDAWYRSTQHAI